MEQNKKLMFNKRSKKQKINFDNSEDIKVSPLPQKRAKKSENQNSLFSFASLSESAPGQIEEDLDPVSEALKNKEISNKIFSGELSSSVYRGKNSYAQYAEKSESTIRASKFTGSLGPVKAPSHLKSTCRFDYSYGLCKDWKVSGYCGYGESCVFVHDRSEFKTGWELEKEWHIEQEEKRKKAFEKKEENQVSENPEKNTEKKCEKCGKEVEVKTICSHFFCFSCSMEVFAKSPKCFVCGKDTQGIFNEISGSLGRRGGDCV